MQLHPALEAQKRILRCRKLAFGQQPTLVAEWQAGHLIRQLQLKLLASLSQGCAELKKMPLNQTGGCSDGQNGPWYGRMEVWHKALVPRFELLVQFQC